MARKLSPNGRALRKAVDPFQRVVRIMAGFDAHRAPGTPIADVIPGAWPSWEDLQRLVRAVEAVLADEVVIEP